MKEETNNKNNNKANQQSTNLNEKDKKPKIKSKDAFYLLYNKLKESTDIPFNPHNFVEHAKLFSQPILYRFLLVFTITKFFLASLYFIFWKKKYFNFIIFINLTMLNCSALLVFKDKLSPYKLFFFLNIINDYYTRRILQVIYIMSFIYIDNYQSYYFPDFTFSVNLGVPVFIFITIIIFESNHFHQGLLYIYIWNFLCFLYFFSLRSFLNVYLPVNIDIALFVLISVIAHNIGRKLIKCEVFLKFYEKVLEIVSKELGVELICDEKLVYPNKKKEEDGKVKLNRKESIGSKKYNNSQLRFIDDLMMDENSNENDYVSSNSMISDRNIERFAVKGFERFEICVPNSNLKDLPI